MKRFYLLLVGIIIWGCGDKGIDRSNLYSDPDKIPSDLTKQEIEEVIKNPNKYHTTIFHSDCKPHIGSWTETCFLIDADITGSDLISMRKLNNVTLRTFCDIPGHHEKDE